MNAYYYLFYKINRFVNKKGNNEWGPILGITSLIGLNLSILYSFFISTNENSYYLHRPYLIGIYIILYGINSILFLNKNRVKRIMKQYEGESNKNRILGGVLVILYVVISIILIFIV